MLGSPRPSSRLATNFGECLRKLQATTGLDVVVAGEDPGLERTAPMDRLASAQLSEDAVRVRQGWRDPVLQAKRVRKAQQAAVEVTGMDSRRVPAARSGPATPGNAANRLVKNVVFRQPVSGAGMHRHGSST